MTHIAELCSGYGGLSMGLTLAGTDHEIAWWADTDPTAETVMAAHHPDAPNLGDITQIEDPPHVDIVTAGFPCQPVSSAGLRAGISDERWIIDDVCRVARAAGARTLVLENVRGLLTANDGDALAAVCAAMARQGFSRWEWAIIRASDVGAPHQRARWFCVAHADHVTVEPLRPRRRPLSPGDAANPDGAGQQGQIVSIGSPWVARCGNGPADTNNIGRQRPGPARHRRPGSRNHDQSPTDPDGATLRPEPVTVPGCSDQAEPRPDREAAPDADSHRWGQGMDHQPDDHLPPGSFGQYEPAVRRWEHILGRAAPHPRRDTGQLSPRFVEWMMGLPAGWVTALDIAPGRQLHALGNGVVPQQAALAIRGLS